MENFICKSCGNKCKSRIFVRGYFIIELILWLSFLLPGLLYSCWRLTGKAKVCEFCKSPEIVILDSPIGKKLVSEYSEYHKETEKKNTEKTKHVLTDEFGRDIKY